MNEEMKRQAREYNDKIEWKFSELRASEELHSRMRFESKSDLDFGAMDFYYDGMLSQILKDASERSEREGYYEGYVWGKRYLEHYVGYGCLLPKTEHPALHSEAAYDMVLDKLIEECEAGDERGIQNGISKP